MSAPLYKIIMYILFKFSVSSADDCNYNSTLPSVNICNTRQC